MIGRLQWHNAYPLAPWVLTSEPWRHLHHSINYGSAVGSKAQQEVPMRSVFPMILQNPELLTPSASDCAARRRLTKSEDKETIIINRSGRSTYPEEKSVQTSGATPVGDHDI